jgi:hypothetical protein
VQVFPASCDPLRDNASPLTGQYFRAYHPTCEKAMELALNRRSG